MSNKIHNSSKRTSTSFITFISFIFIFVVLAKKFNKLLEEFFNTMIWKFNVTCGWSLSLGCDLLTAPWGRGGGWGRRPGTGWSPLWTLHTGSNNTTVKPPNSVQRHHQFIRKQDSPGFDGSFESHERRPGSEVGDKGELWHFFMQNSCQVLRYYGHPPRLIPRATAVTSGARRRSLAAINCTETARFLIKA